MLDVREEWHDTLGVQGEAGGLVEGRPRVPKLRLAPAAQRQEGVIGQRLVGVFRVWGLRSAPVPFRE